MADQVREARPGERCGCGRPARAALIRKMGDVPTCKTPDEYRRELDRNYRMSQAGVLRSAGNSGAR